MILLDTNVISELMRPLPEPKVVEWLDSLPEEEVWISAVTIAEIQLGIAILPDGRRKALLAESAKEMVDEDFAERCLPFDCEAAGTYAVIVAERNRIGLPVTVEDAQIAAIAITAGLDLATRNVKDFTEIQGLKVINPWLDQD